MWPQAMDCVCVRAFVCLGEGVVGREERAKRAMLTDSPLGVGGDKKWELAWLSKQACKPGEKIAFGDHRIQYQGGTLGLLPRNI